MLNITYRSIRDGECEAIICFGGLDMEAGRDFGELKSRRVSKVRLVLASGIIVAMTLPQFVKAVEKAEGGMPFAHAVFESASNSEMRETLGRIRRSVEAVSPDYFTLGDDGAVKAVGLSRNFVGEMQAAGRKVTPKVTYDGVFWEEIMAKGDQIGAALGEYVARYGFDGLIVDIKGAEGAEFSDFLAALRDKVGADISAVVYPMRHDYEYDELNGLCDTVYVNVLGERAQERVSAYYSVAQARKMLEKAVSGGVDKGRIMLALDMGARIWGAGWDGSIPVSPKQTGEIMELFAVRERYDEKQGAVFLDFTVKPGVRYYVGAKRLYPGDYTLNTGLSAYARQMLTLPSRLGLRGAALLDLPLVPHEVWDFFHSWLSGGYFEDITTAYGRDEIMSVCAMGVMEGVGEGRFAPYERVTRGEAAAIVCRFLGLGESEKGTPFEDVRGHWAEKYIGACYEAGQMIGDSDGNFRPDMPLTREQAAVLCARMSGVAERSAGGVFGDVEEGSWSYESVAALHRLGIIRGYSDGTFRPKERMTREELAIVVDRLAKVM